MFCLPKTAWPPTCADTPQIYRLGWCQDYPDANNFDREVFLPGGSANPNTDGKVGGVSWSDDKFNQLVLDAAKETDVKKRVDMYAQAEQILVHDDAVIAPIYWYTRLSVTKPYITRTFSVLGGLEHYEKWDVAAQYTGKYICNSVNFSSWFNFCNVAR